MAGTVPISDVVPLGQWVLAYHDFQTRLERLLRETDKSVHDLHVEKLGPETRPGVWERLGCHVYVRAQTVSLEVPESTRANTAMKAFNSYQDVLLS